MRRDDNHTRINHRKFIQNENPTLVNNKRQAGSRTTALALRSSDSIQPPVRKLFPLRSKLHYTGDSALSSPDENHLCRHCNSVARGGLIDLKPLALRPNATDASLHFQYPSDRHRITTLDLCLERPKLGSPAEFQRSVISETRRD